MMNNDGRRAPFRRHEFAKGRRERRLRSGARLRLQLCRDTACVAAHRGGHDSRVMQKILLDSATQTVNRTPSHVTFSRICMHTFQ